MTEIIKGHPRLLRGLSFFFPQVKKSISPKDNSTIHHEDKRTIILKAKATNPPEAEHRGAKSKYTIRERIEHDWENFMDMLKTRFRSLDTHVVESFLKIMILHNEGKMSEKEVKEEVVDLLYYHEDLIDKVDAASVIARVEELMKDHLNLLLGFCVFLSAKMSFITKVKARFQGDGSHVVDSVLQIMKVYSEGNKSKNDVYQEVGALIQGHGDLLMELSEIFSDS
ncbi:unnamed protein product [Arabidopsis arenosa]|uniref:Uncharacterized protein n=1 Tax=Arabidopsis arenosa TaxID=38785 RepID=A0A8S1ZF55_ARAAE|nr:unnamed protein product [Arabidopsis arenosa]